MFKLKKVIPVCMTMGIIASGFSFCKALNIIDDRKLPVKKARPIFEMQMNDPQEDQDFQSNRKEFSKRLHSLMGEKNTLNDYINISRCIACKENTHLSREVCRKRENCLYFLYKNRKIPNFEQIVEQYAVICRKLESEKRIESIKLSQFIEYLNNFLTRKIPLGNL